MYAPQKLSMKTLAEDDRPREKLIAKGRSALSDAELLAILIASGSRNESALDLSKRMLLGAGNNLDRLARMEIGWLKSFTGMGEAKALTLIAALELARRRNAILADDDQSLRIKGSADAYRIIRPQLDDLEHEEFWIMLTNRANVVMRKEMVSKGGTSATVVDPKVIFKTALSHGATSIVLCHNHPSGSVKPSDQDIRLTKKLREASQFMDIGLLDHIIVGANTYFSFADEGLV
jgi:DNA repair protein RadC